MNRIHRKSSNLDTTELDQYCVLVADIKDSRTGDQERWGDLTSLLETIRVNLNKIFTDNMDKEVVFTEGDSIQGVFYHIQEAYLYGRLLQKLFVPEVIRVGLGVGSVFSALEDKNSNYSTGKAFVEAKDALWRAKHLNYDFYVLPKTGKSMDINLIIELVSSIKSLQTDYQKELDLMVECIYSFWNYEFHLPNYYLMHTLRKKNTLGTFSNSNPKNDRMTLFLSNWENEVAEFCNIVELDFLNENYDEIGKVVNPQGIQSDIALLTESKRQTISKMYNLARIEQIRKYEAVIYKKLGEFYDDNTFS